MWFWPLWKHYDPIYVDQSKLLLHNRKDDVHWTSKVSEFIFKYTRPTKELINPVMRGERSSLSVFFVNFALPTNTTTGQCWENSPAVQQMYCMQSIYTWNGAHPARSTCIELSLGYKRSKLVMIFGCKDKWACSLCLQWISALQIKHLRNLHYFKYVGFWYGPELHQVD